MLSIPAGVRIYLALEPCDMRRGFDGLALLVQQPGRSKPRLASDRPGGRLGGGQPLAATPLFAYQWRRRTTHASAGGGGRRRLPVVPLTTPTPAPRSAARASATSRT